MPLIDLKTDLKSLKYGHDRPGGGNSGQPYITNDINNPKNRLGFDDGLIRGGAIGALKASINDTARIGKFLTDLPKGPLFIIKQVGLQFSNPKLEIKKVSTGIGFIDRIADFAQDKFGLGPTRLYNLGINTLAQVPVNAFGIHFNRHGLLPVQDDSTKYLAVAQENNAEGTNGKNNRLVGYKTKFKLGDRKTNDALSLPRTGILGALLSALPFKFAPSDLTIDNYLGGPKSIYGIGNTLIRRYDSTEDGTKINAAKNKSIGGQAHNPTNNDITSLNPKVAISTEGPSIAVYDNLDKVILPKSPALQKYKDIITKIDAQSKPGNSSTYGNIFVYNEVKKADKNGLYIVSFNNSYNDQPIKYRNGRENEDFQLNGSWFALNREKRIGSGRTDSINLTPLLNEKSAGSIGDEITIGGNVKNIKDLVKFRIQALNGDNPTNATYMIFRAYITQYSDNTDATWNSVKYAGRGEDFYIYNGFSRKIQIGFKVAALSKEEMKPMYQKLNFLMGNLMPDYKSILMRGPLVKMTVGNWIDGQDGILNSLSYTIPQDSPWEIAINDTELILPHIIEVNMTFTPIGSQTKGINTIASKSTTTSHIAQNYGRTTNKVNYIE